MKPYLKKTRNYSLLGWLLLGWSCFPVLGQQTDPPSVELTRQVAWYKAMDISLQKAKILSDMDLSRLKQLAKENKNTMPWLNKIKKAERLKLLTAVVLGEIYKFKSKIKDIIKYDNQTEMEVYATSIQQYTEKGGGVWYFERINDKIKKWFNYLNKRAGELKLTRFKPLNNAYGGGDNYYLTCYKGEDIITTLLILTQTQLAILEYSKVVMRASMKTK